MSDSNVVHAWDHEALDVGEACPDCGWVKPEGHDERIWGRPRQAEGAGGTNSGEDQDTATGR